MNIPLNINLQQIFLHLFNFSILSLGLYLLLYNPVKKFMDKRADHYKKLENDVEEKLKEAKELEASYKKRLENMDKMIEKKTASAIQEANQTAEAILKDANEQAEKILSEAKQDAQEEAAKILEDTQEEITQMAISATEKLLVQSSSGALDQFLDTVKKE